MIARPTLPRANSNVTLPGLSVNDVASGLGFHATTIYAAVNSGELKAFKVRGRWRIAPDDVQAWLQKGQNEVLDEAQGESHSHGRVRGGSPRPAPASHRASRVSFRQLAKEGKAA
jgi:excisionase family DNA binding protein